MSIVTTALTSPINSVYMANANSLPVDATPSEILQAGNMDFTVALEPIYTRDGTAIPQRRAIRNQSTGDVYGVAGPKWLPTQHAALAETAVIMRDQHGLELVGAGSTNSGQNGYIIMRTNNAIDTGNGDVVRGYVALQNPHRYGYAVTANAIGERLYCANQIVFGRGNLARYHHNAYSGYTVQRALSALNLLHDGLNELQQLSEQLRGYRMSANEMLAFVRRVFGLTQPDQDDPDYARKINRYYNRLADLTRTMRTMPGSAEAGDNTAWQALNLVTYHADHVQNSGNAEKRLASATHGVAAKRKKTAIKMLCDHVGIEPPRTLIAA